MARKARYLVVRGNGEHRSIHDTRAQAEAAAQVERENDARAIEQGWSGQSWGYSVIAWSGRVW